MAIKSLHEFFYYHSKYLNNMKCQEISMGLSIGEIQCRFPTDIRIFTIFKLKFGGGNLFSPVMPVL